MGRRPWVRRCVGSVRLTAWIPYGDGSNRAWLLETLGPRIRPAWNKPDRRWEIARPHLRVLVTELAERFGEVDVYLEFSVTERRDSRCRDAQGDDCECSCLGENHGGAAYWKHWIPVGETTLIAPGRRQRHLRVRRAVQGPGLMRLDPHRRT